MKIFDPAVVIAMIVVVQSYQRLFLFLRAFTAGAALVGTSAAASTTVPVAASCASTTVSASRIRAATWSSISSSRLLLYLGTIEAADNR